MNKLKDYNTKDTIVAIATHPAASALGVIKISGNEALTVISRIFAPSRKKNLSKVKTYTLHHGWIIEGKLSCKVDEVLVSIMRRPHSYTTEDVVEISSHGGAVALNKILKLALSSGARIALPGEFTYRALLYGRIDLLQAESILGIVEAKSEDGLKVAVNQLQGAGTEKINLLKEAVKETYALTEAFINFPEDDVDICVSDIKKRITALSQQAQRLLNAASQGKIIKEGVRCVICGRTNAGKSTLFNRLLKEERVIVTRTPGTTRDVIEETILINGLALRIYDTAGILEPKDLVARRALAKTQQAFDGADLVILIIDSSRPLGADDKFLLKKVKGKNTVVAINKIDLPQRLSPKDLLKINPNKVKLSALKNIGITRLEKTIAHAVGKNGAKREDLIFLSRYQEDCLNKVAASLAKAKEYTRGGQTIDFVNLALKQSLDELGKLSGEVLPTQVLESIFSNFCIGK